MARIDRRVSPNQLSLWTVAELFRPWPSVTARRSIRTRPVHGGQYGWIRVVLRLIATVFGHVPWQCTATSTPCAPSRWSGEPPGDREVPGTVVPPVTVP